MISPFDVFSHISNGICEMDSDKSFTALYTGVNPIAVSFVTTAPDPTFAKYKLGFTYDADLFSVLFENNLVILSNNPIGVC